MSPKLYCCSLLFVFALASLVRPGDGIAQELIPLPSADQTDDPFADDENSFQDKKLGASQDKKLGASKKSLRIRPLLPPHAFDPQPSLDRSTVPFSLINLSTLDRLHSPLLRQDLQIKGAASCATSNCHGGPRPGISQPWARRGSEYQIWVEDDPHAQSWRTICGNESIAIMRRLNIMQGDKIVDQAGFDNCLACHNSTQKYDEPRRALPSHHQHMSSSALSNAFKLASNRTHSLLPADTNTFLREGIGCSGCHGPSEQWAQTHYQQHWTPHGATNQGFVEARDLFVRARMCASCHVGDKDRDMNHDIIAAGHPTLRYEMATFHAWQPKHWRDSESEDKTYYEAQLWLAGQVAATDASLALLESRTAGAHSVSEWPELAAYNCASCHHSLGLDNSRSPFRENRSATAMYSQWNNSGIRWVANYRIETGQATNEDHELIRALDLVTSAMERRPAPSPHNVSATVSAARAALAAWLDGQAGLQERSIFRSERLGQVIASAAGKRETFRTWESSVQFYLAAVAARESWPGGWNGNLKNVADRMRVGLRYPEMIDISRYSKRSGGRSTLNRFETMKLGIELAGWLGQVQFEPMLESNDEVTTQQMQDQLKQLIEQMDQRLEEIAKQRAILDAKKATDKTAEKKAKDDEDSGRDDEKKKPEVDKKSREELRKEMEKELKALEANSNSDQ